MTPKNLVINRKRQNVDDRLHQILNHRIKNLKNICKFTYMSNENITLSQKGLKLIASLTNFLGFLETYMRESDIQNPNPRIRVFIEV